MRIIPAIDIIDGKCVRLEKGDYSKKKVYSADPVEIARMFESWGLRRLHLVDLDGAKASHIVNFTVLNKITSATSLIVDFGGGIKSEEDLHIAAEVSDDGREITEILGGSVGQNGYADIVDEIIEKALATGAQVKFADNGSLKSINPMRGMAVITRY